MTIGIATVGPNAGLGLFKGLRAAERVGTGSIGGFATFAAITADRRLIRSQTQRGGSSTLFLDGETTGVEPSEEVAAAPCAAVISSGPERRRNSARVLKRPDLAEYHAESLHGAAKVIVFYNAIRPLLVIAPLVAQIALDAMLGLARPDGEIFMAPDLPVRAGPEIAIFCDTNGVAQYVTTPDRLVLAGTHVGAIIQQGSPVYAEDRLIGHAMFEVMTLVVDGVLKEMSGQPSMRAGIKHIAA